MGKSFQKPGEMNGSSYVKIPLTSSALVNIKNDDKYCFIWPTIANLHPCNINPDRLLKYEKYLNELYIQGFDFTNGFKCGDMHKFEKLNDSSINIYELNFYKNDKKWKHKILPIEISKNDTVGSVFDLAVYKYHYAFIKKVNVFIGKEYNKYICRRCLNSYTSENMITKQKQQCIQKQITSIRTSPESHLHWKNQFHKNHIYFWIYADFKVDNEKEVNTADCNKITNFCKQNPVCNG